MKDTAREVTDEVFESERMSTSLTQHLEMQQGPLRAALAELVRIPSICQDDEGAHPFGEAVDRALRKALEIAGSLGFRTHYGEDGYYGWAETGAGEELVGILGHLDVMPPGRLEEWMRDPFGLAYQEFDWLAPLYLPLDHFMIQTLMRVYQEVSGDTVSEPISSGGATYARSMPNCVAFGPLLHDEAVTEHQPNERVPLANLYKAMEIYAHAIIELTR